MRLKKLLFFILIGSLFLNSQTKNIRRSLPPIELRGSKEQRVIQNSKANELRVPVIGTEEELKKLVADGKLLELKSSRGFFVDRGGAKYFRNKKRRVSFCSKKENKIFVRPEVKFYLDIFSEKYFKKFNKKFKITSGARSIEEQTLMRTKGSCYYTPYAAIAANQSEESLHTRGIAFDISRIGMSRKEIVWIRETIIKDKNEGVELEVEDQEDPSVLETDPIEERVCYHIVVFKLSPIH